MSAPSPKPRKGPATRSCNWRLDPDLVDRLEAAATERVVSVRWIVERLLGEGLDSLIPVEEFSLTRGKRSSTFRKRLDEIETVEKERDLADLPGHPIVTVPPEMLRENGSGAAYKEPEATPTTETPPDPELPRDELGRKRWLGAPITDITAAEIEKRGHSCYEQPTEAERPTGVPSWCICWDQPGE